MPTATINTVNYVPYEQEFRDLCCAGVSKYNAMMQVMSKAAATTMSVKAQRLLRVKLTRVWRTQCCGKGGKEVTTSITTRKGVCRKDSKAKPRTNTKNDTLPSLCRSSTEPNTYYTVDSRKGTCTCPDYIYRKKGTNAVCKHVRAVRRHPDNYVLFACVD